MNDDQYLLASAYLDGELAADQRRLAEADPDVMSEVDRMLVVRSQLRAIEPPSERAREAAIAAAMAAFMPAMAQPAPPINASVRTVEFRRRPSYARFLGIAAAAVAVGLLGLVVAAGLRSGGDDSSDFDAASDAIAEEPAGEPADEPASAELDRSLTESAPTDGEGDLAGAVAADDAMSDADQPADEPAEVATAEAPVDELAVNPVAPLIDPDQPLTTPAELGAYGAYLRQLEAAGELPPTPNTDCPQQVILGSTQFVFDGLPIDVLIAVDDRQRTVTAIDPDTCEALEVGPLF